MILVPRNCLGPLCMFSGGWTNPQAAYPTNPHKPMDWRHKRRTTCKSQLRCKVKALRLQRTSPHMLCRFPHQTVMATLGITFPQYWLTSTCDLSFNIWFGHFETLYGKEQHYHGEEIEFRCCSPVLNAHTLDAHTSYFKIPWSTMWEWPLDKLVVCENLFSSMWRKRGANQLSHLLLHLQVCEVGRDSLV